VNATFCPALIDPACVIGPVAGQVFGSAAGAAAGGAMASIAHTIQAGIAWLAASTVDWWVQVPSPDLAAEPAVGTLQQWLLPITVAVAVLAMLAAAGKMALTRKANPLADVGSGLAIIAVTSAIGVLLPSLLLKAGDAWSSWILAASTGGQFGSRLTTLLTLDGASPGVVVVLGMVAIIMTAIQAVLMLFRQAALVILAGVLPLAAVGTLTQATRAWFRRVAGWMLALIFYKPAAAAVYATAFAMIGRGKDPRTILMGFTMVLLSLVALPALMKFFTWTTGSIDGPGGGGLLGTVVSGAIAVGALRASSGGFGGGSAADQARLMAAQLGPPGGPGPPGGAGAQGGGGPRPGPPPAGGPNAASGQGLAGGGPGAGGPVQAGAGPSGAATATGAGTAAGAGAPVGAASAGGGTGTAAGGAGTAASGAGAVAGAGAAAGAAAGPVGVAAAGLASGAVSGAMSAARKAADAMQPEQGGE